ncbi:interferon-induced helicase C domain-containing protein 1-like isoform X1 [Mizuhopecten yessoensis]|uniref:interferon-induced helicase C domain-containing protein 1-like isoform X1 n=1 Tax=Mizuhopecten yessoensis TaxID=6573 RepID=UPI000B45A673|nr:interferon-induced helicase C domain-containing protein 1-like isoform X1 [Mizuhopecten yessoensis]
MYHIALCVNNVLCMKNVVDHLKRSSLTNQILRGDKKNNVFISYSSQNKTDEDNTGSDNADTDISGIENADTDISGIENADTDISGSDNTGVIRSGSYNTGVDNTGSYDTGVDNSGSYDTGVDNTGSYDTGVDNTGVDNTGSYDTGVDKTESYNTGVDNTGSYDTGVDNTGSYDTGVDNTERDNTGVDKTGSYDTGVDNTGSYNTAENNTGTYNTGVDNTGRDNTGEDNTGRDNTGEDNTGEDNTGRDNTGEDNTKRDNTGRDNTGEDNTGEDNTGSYDTGRDNTVVTLVTLYEEVVKELECLSMSQENENPNIVRLQEMVDEIFREKGKDSTFIVFVETRDSAKDVSEYLNEKSDFAKCWHLISSRSTAEEDQRQSLANRTRVVQRLREKELNGLVATPVAEEGLDIPSCNFVIRYNKSSNEISTIQTAGRSRAMQGTVIDFADQQKHRQEEVNVMRLTLMNQALENILSKPIDEIMRTVAQRMRSLTIAEAEEERNRQTQLAAKTQSNFTLRCWECQVVAVSSCDIRCFIKSQYIVVGREFYNKVKCRRNKKVCKYGGMTKKYKIDCKNCGCDWGVGACNDNNVFFAVLKIKQFIARDDDTGIEYIRENWTKLPFTVQTMAAEDFSSLAGVEELIEHVQDS